MLAGPARREGEKLTRREASCEPTPERGQPRSSSGQFAGYWSQESIIAAIQRFVAQHGRPPSNDEWVTRKDDSPSATTVREHFGTWTAGINAAGYVTKQTWNLKPHGTRASYDRGCRCEPCVADYRERVRKSVAALKGKEPPRHGTATAYSNWACRCDECLKVGREVSAMVSHRNYVHTLEKRRESSRRWDAENSRSYRPKKNQRAMNRLRDLLKAGKISKPRSCQDCGVEPGLDHAGKSLLWAHWLDADAFDFVWVCSMCSGRRRSKYRGEGT